MFPVLIKLGPVTVHTYGFMMALGVACAIWFIFVQARRQGMDASRLVDLVFYTVIIGLLGAKLALLVGNFSYYTGNPSELLSLARSGGVFQGGLAAGLVFALWYLRRHRIPTWKTADLIAPAVALAHGFGRIGCFAAGCCFGRACTSPLGVEFTNTYAHDLTGVPINTTIHPVQLYESILNFINFGILFLILRRKRFDGQVFALYILNYSVIRYITEFFRGDHADQFFLFQSSSPYLSMSYSQLFCVVGLLASGLLLVILKKRKHA